MADKKISELTSIVGADTAADDFFVVVDTSGSATKKISRAELNNAIEQDVLAQVDITSANIDGGTIDNTPIGSTTASTGNFTTVDTTGNVTVGGNLTVQGTTVTVDTATVQTVDLGDNDKIRLGNSQNLQLYFDGSNSYVDEQGSGGLNVRGTNLNLTDSAGVRFLRGESGGPTRFYHQGTEVLTSTATGVDVTGTLTADGLTVSSANPNIDVSDTGTSYASQDFLTNSDAVRATIGVERSSGGGLFVGSSAYAAVFGTASSGSTQFATNNNVRMTIDSSGNAGIGTASPSDKLHVEGDIRVNNAIESANNLNLEAENGALRFYTGSGSPSERARFDSSGVFMLGQSATGNPAGTTSTTGVGIDPSGYVSSNRDGGVSAIFGRISSDGELVRFTRTGSTVGSVGINSSRTYIGSGSGQSGIKFNTNAIVPAAGADGANSDNTYDLGISSARFKNGYFSNSVLASNYGSNDDPDTYINFPLSNIIRFYTGGGERARLDASGNLLVGKTTITGAFNTVGIELRATGLVQSTVDSAKPLDLNRKTTTGEIIGFNYNGTAEGSVTITASGVTYNTTSDLRLKENIEPLVATDKLMAMNPVSYNWKSDPDGPRSMGFIAQEMQEIMPEAVAVGDDEDAMMSMDYGRITPVLVAALQDAHRKIEELAAEIAELKAK